MRHFLITLATVVTFAVFPSNATELPTGNQLYGLCTGTTVQKNACIGYVAGAINYAAFVLPVVRPPFCPPEGVMHDLTFAIFTRYLQVHPEKRHDLAIELLVLALAEA